MTRAPPAPWLIPRIPLSPIDNLQEFEAACSSDSRLAYKLISVRNRDCFYRLSYDLVRPVTQEFGLDIPTAGDGDGTVRLVFRSRPGDRHRILKLLDDDFPRSSMMNHHYEVNSKTES